MKNLFTLLFFLATTIIYSQTEIGNFKVKDGRLIWQKIYEENLNLESQDLKLRALGLPKMTTTFFIQDISGAKLKVQKKDGRTRLNGDFAAGPPDLRGMAEFAMGLIIS